MAEKHLCKQILLFGDQTVDLYPSIFDLYLRERDSFDLRQFSTICNQTLKREASSTSYWKERQLPPFETILELAQRLSSDKNFKVTITTVLLCVTQLGNLILLAQKNQTIFTGPPEVKTAGVCTGALIGAVLEVATSVNDLIGLTPAIVLIALRIGIAASLRSSAIENLQERWAILLSAISKHDIEAAIESFQSKHHRSDKQVFISASTENSFTITAPPSVLTEFIESGILKSAKHASLPLGAAFHAPHLPTPGIHAIVQIGSLPYSAHIPKGSLVSTSTGKPYNSVTFSDLLVEVIHDVLSRPMNLEIFAKCLAYIVGDSPASLVPVGPENCANYFKRKLQEFGCQMNDPENHENLSRVPIIPRYSGSIAILGMAGRFPGGTTLESFWEVLENGCDLHKKIPADRFDVNTHYDSSGRLRNSTLTPYGVFIDNPGHFDARMFNISPRETAQTDPMQRPLLTTTHEALDMSGYSSNWTPSTQSHRIGSFFGQTSDDWREVNSTQDIDTYFITGGIRAFGPGRLNYHFKWEGPSYSIDTACSSSFASIQVACSALRALECDTAVAGGASILTASDIFSGLSRGGFLSSTGGCKTFDNAADGYCRGDAVGTVVLKRFEDAIDDNDNILSVIRGIDTNHSAHAVSITHPHKPTQQRLFRSVLRQANLLPEDVDYVEMHGTGTQAGDFTELSAISGVFGNNRSPHQPLYIGTLKPNVGHGEAASGITLIKAVMMLRKNLIPPHVGIKGNINHRLPSMKEANIVLPREKIIWSGRENRKRIILINNFDASGGNTSLLLEDPPCLRLHQIPDPRKHHVVAVSGRTPKALRNNQIRLLQYLQETTPRLKDIAYTTTARRQNHIFRSAYECKSISSLMSILMEDGKQPVLSERIPESSTVFVFTGQGSEWAGMVLSGYKDDVANLRKCLDLQNIKSTVLSVRYAFHSPQMDPVLGKYRQIIKAVRFTKATIPFASAYQSDIIMTGHSIAPEYLVQQTRQPVKFQSALQVLKTKAQIDDSTMWLDLGPRPFCLNMIQQSLNVHPSHLIAVNDANRHFWHISAQNLAKSYKGAEKHLRTAVRGHSVNGTLLCPSSVYGDMAIGAAAYVFSKTHPNEKMLSFDVYNMEVIKPLLANDDGKDQWIQITATKQKDDEFLSISISSHESETLLKHVSCVVKHSSGADWMSKWARNAYFVKASVENLMKGIAQKSTQQILRPIAYKLFSNLVTYDKKYQGMERVYLNSDLYEAAAEIEFQSAYSDGSFHVSPYWIDSILHISGFILNGSEMTSKDTVYISHGWRSLRIARPLSHTKRYRNYVRMQPTDTREVMAGDIYVFDGDEIIAVCKGLKFQEIKRKVLDLLLERQSNSLAAMQGAIKLPTSQTIANLPITKEPRSYFGEILEIIASEAEIGLDELTDNARLIELGIDSLLAMGIVERIRIFLKCADIPSSIFFDFQTVSQLRTFFSNNFGSYESSERETTRHSEKLSAGSSTRSTRCISDEDLSNRKFPEILRTILSEELKIPKSEIGPSTRFAEIGVDSLMALNTISMIRSKACKNIDSNFFCDYPSFGDVLKLEYMQGNGVEHSESTLLSKETYYGPKQSPQATSVILQQRPASNFAIFLFPDGGGSAASYAGLPPIHPSATIYGLISPFIKSPADFNGTTALIASLYVGEICKKQKSGPYILGGWSIGGIYAYEAARQLIIQGEKVRQHFQSTILALEKYRLEAIPDGKRPHCLAISAKMGVLDSTSTNQEILHNMDGISDATSRWLMQARNELEDDGWEEMFSEFERRFVEANHFTMMQRPVNKAVAELISEFIGKCEIE
ncbi:hypothetical protein DID88_005493 [Monilinia fructigena]|uniref:Carrier domain-containing protein n=1 Tax=Monilinia fructigena TaxID=38457 RepID=A0A395J010_9HELO|nr:hypothetical protein DID88_005493 [Monilinia fructigena]